MLSDQVKFLSLNNTGSLSQSHQQLQQQPRGSPSSSHSIPTSAHGQSMLRQTTNTQPNTTPPSTYSQISPQYQQPPPPLPNQWYGPPLAAPQASHPLAPPPPPPAPLAAPISQRSPHMKDQLKDDWDEQYLLVLQKQDASALRDLLARSNPDVIMPTNGPTPLSQAVVLTLLHRVCVLVALFFIYS